MIEVQNRQRAARIKVRRFERLVNRLLRRYRRGRADVVLAFVGTATIRRLNRTFRGKDEVTDVLSFPGAGGAGRGPDGRLYLGDIVVCVPRASRQAAELGQSLEAELAYLTIHGFLHLLGYEHGRGHEAEETKALSLLKNCGIAGFPSL
jgi:probable rRNA maturation factor